MDGEKPSTLQSFCLYVDTIVEEYSHTDSFIRSNRIVTVYYSFVLYFFSHTLALCHISLGAILIYSLSLPFSCTQPL